MVGHEVRLRGYGVAEDGGPTILQRTDPDFLAAVVEELRTDRNRVLSSLAQTRDDHGDLKLFQPVHRTFHLALVDVFCRTLGTPRLDPRRIESAGMMLRRFAHDQREAWVRSRSDLLGWLTLPPSELQLDPDPSRRRARLDVGHPEINRRLMAALSEPLAEAVAPLFPAPPDVCAAAGRTVLYGMVPVTSNEITTAAVPALSRTDLADRLSIYLRKHAARDLQSAGQLLVTLDPASSALQGLMGLLWQVAIECDAFGEHASAAPLRFALASLTINASPSLSALEFLRQAADILLFRRKNDLPNAIRMPAKWPEITEAHAEALATAVLQATQGRLDRMAASASRFQNEHAFYEVAAFVRIRRDDGCPPTLVWSAASERFRIAPWYEGGAVPPPRVKLPDPTNKAFLEAVKPNVAFELPPSLANLLAKNPDDILDGSASTAGPDLGFICTFSIPIITICAMLLLSIFLVVFNLIFFWLPFVKICLPLPKSE